ncbi:MAG: DUF2723 domain-containing protein [Caldilineae bacterium]|nr:DUF2723 domain-containing protein [Anaerolineae bacterium]MCB0203230.1 DUF2723 domain-containing protein [Anaerolineae bacterium]MCB9152952.1 DUF2723 domain-containing protein [Caldilineae bacterium]
MRSRVLAPLVVFGSALLVYLLTMPPGLTWAHESADGGDLIAAVVSGSVPHPSGYPTFVLFATPLARLPWQNPAWRVTLLSALAGAASAAFVAATVQTVLGRASMAAIVAGLMLAFSSVFWGQATVVEVYALHACLAAALLWCAVRSRQSVSPAWTAAAGLVFGLALGNHLTSLWLAPLFLVSLLTPTRRGQAVAAGIGGLLAGLCVYLALPLRAAANPLLNWGDASTWDGFWWLVSGQLYRSFVFAAPLQAMASRVAAASGLLLQSFFPWGVALAIVGLLSWPREQRVVNIAMLVSAGLGLVWALGYNTSDSYLSWLPAWPFVAVWLGIGFAALADWLRSATSRGRWLTALLAALLIAAPLALNWQANDLSADRDAEEFVAGVLDTVETDGVVVAAGDRATFGLWYGRYGAGQRPDVQPISRDLWRLASYRDALGAAQPALVADSIEALIDRISAARPVYLTQVGPELLDQPEAPAGAVWESLPAPLDESGRPRWQIYRLAREQ